MKDFDLIVLGAGSAGVRASRMAARAGARVAVVEMAALGGTCVNLGCVPKKLFCYAAEFRHAWEDAMGYGWVLPQPPQFNWTTLRDNKTKEIQRLNTVYQSILENAGVKILTGHARITDVQCVTIGEQIYTAERILIATGSFAAKPSFPGAELACVSDDIFSLPLLPQRVVIIGGGYIACEFASIFYGLGVEVTQLYRGDLFLQGFDDDVRRHIAQTMQQQFDLRMNSTVVKLERGDQGLLVRLHNGDTITTDLFLYAAGRRPNTLNLGLAAVGVELQANGAIQVNTQWQTSVPSIYAIGDVIGRYPLTPVALAEAMAFVKTIYANTPTVLDYHLIPTAVFCEPNISAVGLTETQARQRYPNIKIFKSQFKPLKNTLSGRNTQALVKLIVDGETDKVLGIHVVGTAAGEIVQGFAVALTAGVTKTMLDNTIGIHPTLAEELVTLRETSN